MGAARQGRAAQAARRLRGRLRLERPLVEDAARPQPLLLRRQAVRLRRPLRRLAAGRDRRRLLQQGQGQDRAQDVRRVRGRCWPRRRQTARSRSRSATSTSSAASTSSRPCRTSSPSKDATRDFVFAKDGASFDTAENREAATKLQEWADKGYFTQDFNGTGYDPAWQQFTKGKGPFTIAGTWITNDALKALGDKLGFFLMPGQRGGQRAGLARRREPAVGDHGEVQERRRGGRLHRLHHQRQGRRRAGRDRQPAGDAGDQAALGAGRAGDLRRLEGSSTTPTASRPTWTTRRRRSTTTSRAPCSELLAGKRQAGRVHEVRAGGLREVRRQAVTALAPPGEPRRVAYLYLLPGLVDLRPVRAGAAGCTARGCRCSPGTA